MPFKNVFERRVDENMQQAEAGKAPPAETVDADPEMKIELPPPTPDIEAEAQDHEWTEKKDHPPRFSTLFSAPVPQPPRQFESYPEPKRKSGVFLPTPLFIILAVILLFESTVLFAYTVIGLYNNLPSRLVPGAAGCACEGIDRQPMVNIAPNFVVPQAPAAVTQTVTMVGEGSLPDTLSTSTSMTAGSISSSTSAESSSTSSVDNTSQAAAAASNILGMFGTLKSSTTTSSSSSHIAVVTVTPTSTEILSEVQPTPSTVQSTLLLTVNAAGSTLSPDSTALSTSAIDAAQTTASASSGNAASSLAAEPSSTTLVTSAISTLSPPATTAAPTSVSPPPLTSSPSTTSHSTHKICFGGMRGVNDCEWRTT
ncbi:hypothetical protein LTR85_010407 [Meristemomyces frigidus]|nr:hypothetical protein LTR85_010407 [Meristemomyces frigidus]